MNDLEFIVQLELKLELKKIKIKLLDLDIKQVEKQIEFLKEQVERKQIYPKKAERQTIPCGGTMEILKYGRKYE